MNRLGVLNAVFAFLDSREDFMILYMFALSSNAVYPLGIQWGRRCDGAA